MITLKIKRNHPDAVLPTRAHATDAGMDLTAIDDGVPSKDGRYIEYNTGISIELPPGYHALLHPRSSISTKDLVLANSVGLVDPDYRGNLICRFKIVPPVSLTKILTNNCSYYNWEARTTGVETTMGYPSWRAQLYKKGDRIAQLVIEETILADIVETTDLTDTQRGEKGFGSSDKKE